MHHYVVFTWQPGDISAAHAAYRCRDALTHGTAEWKVLLQREGLAVCCKEAVDPAMRVYILDDSTGIIFGRLFSSRRADRRVEADELNAARILSSGGEQLVRDYWGGYVAVLHSREENTVLVIRDCTGKVPCYHLSSGGMRVLFSDIQDIEPLGFAFTLNPVWLAAYIHKTPLHVRDTALSEVSELLAGDCLRISAQGLSHRCLWNPGSIARTGIVDDYGEAAALLKEKTEEVVRAWAGLYARILLKLSGGLDSAIVLGCLTRMNRAGATVCINHYTESTDDDERRYARLAADMAGARLIEVPRIADANVFVDKLCRLPPAPNPDVPSALGMLAVDALTEAAGRFHCDTIWTGQGGDHVFFQLNSCYPAVDYLLTHRLPYRFPGLLYDSAILSSQSIWRILARAAHFWWHRDAVPSEAFDRRRSSLVDQAAASALPESYTTTPWRNVGERVPPGKQLQIDVFFDLLNRHKPLSMGGCPQDCHPLISQPLIELSLRIPTYHLLKGGRQRAMARSAFADRVPPQILAREDKGSIRNQSRSLIRGSGKLLGDILLHGTLASLGILDLTRLEDILFADDLYRDSDILTLLGCIAVEMWAKRWSADHRGIGA